MLFISHSIEETMQVLFGSPPSPPFGSSTISFQTVESQPPLVGTSKESKSSSENVYRIFTASFLGPPHQGSDPHRKTIPDFHPISSSKYPASRLEHIFRNLTCSSRLSIIFSFNILNRGLRTRSWAASSISALSSVSSPIQSY